MEELLAHPAVQAGAAPFVASLAAAAAFSRKAAWQPLAIGLAFLVVIGLTVGFSFEPLTATRKLVVVGFAGVVATLALQLSLRKFSRPAAVAVSAAAGIGATWMLWRLIAQAEAPAAFLQAAGACAFAGVLAYFATRPQTDSVTAASQSLVLGLAAAVLALLGASALLTQVGIAVAAGAGALLLVNLIAARNGAAIVPALPAAVISACVILLSIFTGSLRWFCAVPVLALPWAARLARGIAHPWLRAMAACSCAAVPLLMAVALARWAGLGFALE